MFQFHKVRLKENIVPKFRGLQVFQFHKVRLKGSISCKNKKSFSMFQFHKVRLKEVGDKDYLLDWAVSIP